ncbi:guanine-specific ribonuclease N1 and T1 [Streptomyces albireticuli]|uniref:Guanine-specific ribonuclease N1 and T1 n=1 Tax=Streptomyces albireticuli TaxID=1940 RepID=A0A1Z2L7D5_9ACTN|nr:guanine-specific ribonuclease N1 and T1 [Streptomyces albireticuli]
MARASFFVSVAGIPLLTATGIPAPSPASAVSPAPGAAARPADVYDPPWPVERFPAQVKKACAIWKGLGWPKAPRAQDYQVPMSRPLVIRGSNVYRNLSRDLPTDGAYREYDVNPRRPGQHRDAERIVRDEGAHAVWYTGDHYSNFRKIESGCE